MQLFVEIYQGNSNYTSTFINKSEMKNKTKILMKFSGCEALNK